MGLLTVIVPPTVYVPCILFCVSANLLTLVSTHSLTYFTDATLAADADDVKIKIKIIKCFIPRFLFCALKKRNHTVLFNVARRFRTIHRIVCLFNIFTALLTSFGQELFFI